MNFLVRNRPQRHTAFAVMLVWLFALASGVANACLLQAEHVEQAEQVEQVEHVEHAHGHGHGPHQSLALHAQGTAQRADHHDASAGDSADADASKAPCLKACDLSTHALVKATSGVDPADPCPAIGVMVLWTVATPQISAVRGLDEPALPVPGPPLRLRYSRLAL